MLEFSACFLTPLLVYKAPHFTAGERALDPLAKLLRARSAEELEESTQGHSDHVVVIGYGLAGQFLTSSLKELKIGGRPGNEFRECAARQKFGRSSLLR